MQVIPEVSSEPLPPFDPRTGEIAETVAAVDQLMRARRMASLNWSSEFGTRFAVYRPEHCRS